MRRRCVVLAVAMALGVGLVVGLVLPGCYDVPQPACGFRCGPNNECPDDYTCSAADGRCHLNGSPEMVCGVLVDAPEEDDAPLDGPPDAAIDAAIDAPPDAAIDAPADAAIDAATDAAIDAAIDAS